MSVTSYELQPVPPAQHCETPLHLRFQNVRQQNASALLGVKLKCEDCGREWDGPSGGWRIQPGCKVFCDKCATAEANE